MILEELAHMIADIAQNPFLSQVEFPMQIEILVKKAIIETIPDFFVRF